MNRDKMISLTNKLSVFLIVLMLYWVFISITVSVFDFKVFRENITQAFFMSIFAIFTLLGGAVILNIMLNMTKISEALASGKKETETAAGAGKSGLKLVLFFASFPVIFGLLYLGDLRTSLVKRNFLVDSARAIVRENTGIMEKFGEYKYNLQYLKEVESSLTLFEKQEENFKNISLIVQDEVHGKTVFLELNRVYDKLPAKANMIFPCSQKEREYLRKVFNGEVSTYRFSSSDGSYELYYPVKTKNRIIVLYFYDYQRYGKIGS